MKNFKKTIFLNTWEIEKLLKVILFVQFLANFVSMFYPKSKWTLIILPIVAIIEISLLFLFYRVFYKVETEILESLNIEVIEQYISKNESHTFRGKTKDYYLVKLSFYYYIFGEFDYSISLLNQINIENLPIHSSNILDYYFTFYLNSVKIEDWDKAESMKENIVMFQVKKKSAYKRKQLYLHYIEIYDKLLVRKQSVQNLKLSNTTSYELLRYCYLSAINALNQGNHSLARSEFQKIISYPDRLYMVREAKEYLESGTLPKYKTSTSVVPENPDSLWGDGTLPIKLRRFKKRYMVLIGLGLIVLFQFITLFLQMDPDIDGVYYLTVRHPSTKTVSLDKSDRIVIEEKKAHYYKDGEELEAVLNEEENTLILDGQEYYYNYAGGGLSLLKLESTTPKIRYLTIEYASDTSPLYEGYEKGTVTYGD